MYRHTQVGWLMILVCGVVLLTLIPALGGGSREGAWLPLLLCVVLLALFCTLTVTLDDETIAVRFGPGLIGKRIALAEVAACRTVRNEWWYGWGIRWIGAGWLYNVSGLD